MESTPFISVLIPLYNRQGYIDACLRSIGPLGGLPVEVVVVDDGSTDGSAASAERAISDLGAGQSIRLVRQANGGPSAARNRAAAEARGEWLVFLDSDDLWQPWTLGVLTEALRGAHADTAMAFFRLDDFADPASFLAMARGPAEVSDAPSFLGAVTCYPRMHYGTCNAAVRRDVFDAAGGFSTRLRCSEDSDLFLRLPGPARLVLQPVMAGLRRAGQDSLTGHAPSVAEGFHAMVRADRAGQYQGSPAERRAFLAGACVYSIRAAFSSGWPLLGYGLYLRNFARLFNHRTRRHLWRLPLTPVLHLLRPGSYPFRFRPVRRT